jgi:hypothetical protein
MRAVLRITIAILSAVVVVVLAARLARARASSSWTEGPQPAPPSGHAVVLVELFTSEGCSSCPPADAVLSTLVHDQPLPQVEVLGLGEHVDYWDHLGWRDPYSSAAFSKRQSEYASRVFHTADIYTPQLVIDGQYESVGSDIAAIRRAIVRAANSAKAFVRMTVTARSSREVVINVEATVPPGVASKDRADIIAALVQDHATDDVTRGENRGRSLTHSSVVRALTVVGSMAGSEKTASAIATLPLPASPATGLRVVAFLQDRRTLRVLGAATALVD